MEMNEKTGKPKPVPAAYEKLIEEVAVDEKTGKPLPGSGSGKPVMKPKTNPDHLPMD